VRGGGPADGGTGDLDAQRLGRERAADDDVEADRGAVRARPARVLHPRRRRAAPCGWPLPPASSRATVEDEWGNFGLAVGERKFWVRDLVTVRDLILRMGLVFEFGLLEIV
jgi:hypothetical protein